MRFKNFTDAIDMARLSFHPSTVHSSTWQGVDITKKPEMAMHEVLNYSFTTRLSGELLDAYRLDIKPNLPWTDNHFLERVGGEPLNPGIEWANWPNAKSADTFRDAKGQFNHNYMERYWPKFAGVTEEGKTHGLQSQLQYIPGRFGIRGNYGDLGNVISLLTSDPLTRQAYLPVWFPEDTGDANPGRKPCTLGYHFICRDSELHVVYYIRSCDFVRHFRDDIYLTVRLLLWILDKLREKDKIWSKVKPGTFTMHITSLHMFRNDYLLMREKNG